MNIDVELLSLTYVDLHWENEHSLRKQAPVENDTTLLGRISPLGNLFLARTSCTHRDVAHSLARVSSNFPFTEILPTKIMAYDPSNQHLLLWLANPNQQVLYTRPSFHNTKGNPGVAQCDGREIGCGTEQNGPSVSFKSSVRRIHKSDY